MLSDGRKKKSEKDRLLKLEDERQKLEEEMQKIREGQEEDEEEKSERVEVAVIVKADVQGTVQAVSDALKCLNSPQVVLFLKMQIFLS